MEDVGHHHPVPRLAGGRAVALLPSRFARARPSTIYMEHLMAQQKRASSTRESIDCFVFTTDDDMNMNMN